MEEKHEIALEEPAEPETEAARDETPVSQPEAEATKSAEEVPQPEPDAPAVAEAESEAGCATDMYWEHSFQKCGRNLHAAPAGIDEQPVCLMHSKDPNKQSGPLFDAFWLEFERILEAAGKKEAHFEKFVFPRTDLGGREINAICLFDRAIFTQDAVFFCAIFKRKVSFEYATFIQYANFWKASFTWYADFSKVLFMQFTRFSGAIFELNANFSGATFTKETEFHGAAFTYYADFSEATFMHDVFFNNATYTGNANFRKVTFVQNAIFDGTEFYGTADWRRCRFLDQAEFRHTVFKPKKELSPSAVFSLAKFAKPGEIIFDDVDLSRALFLNCDVSELWFTSSVKWPIRFGYRGFRGLAVSEEEILLIPMLAQLKEDYGPIDHGAVEQIYHQLQKNYDSRLDYRKANDFHYGEMEMRRLEPPSSGPFLSLRRRIPRWLNLLTLYRLASDYGNSYAKPGAWLLGILLAAMLAFPITGLEMKQPKPGNATSNAIVTYGTSGTNKTPGQTISGLREN